MDNQKYIVMTFLGLAALTGFAFRGLLVPMLAKFEVGDPQVFLGLTASTLGAIALGIATFLVLNRHPVAYAFTDETIAELRKVVWPDKEETVRSTTVVVGFTIVVALALAGYDFIWARLTSMFLFTEG